jgi:hypothetical protein
VKSALVYSLVYSAFCHLNVSMAEKTTQVAGTAQPSIASVTATGHNYRYNRELIDKTLNHLFSTTFGQVRFGWFTLYQERL